MSVLITGFPRLLARGLIRRSLNLDPTRVVRVLVAQDDVAAAEAFVATLESSQIEMLVGEPGAIDLGLAGPTVRALLEDTTLIFHAGLTRDLQPARSERADLVGLANLLGMAADMHRLDRLCIFSTAFVSGNRRGVIYEEELDAGQRFNSPFERSMFAAERLARASMPRLPITILRPSALIGHSQTGDATGLSEGPNYLIQLMINMPAEVPFVLPGRGVVPFNIVPIDYVVRAAWVLANAPEARSRTFHLTDPNPVSAQKACEMLGELAANRPAPMRALGPTRLLTAVMRLTRLNYFLPKQAALFVDLTRQVTYHCGGTLAVLAATDVHCPPFESYADALITWVAHFERDRAAQVAG
ncbi:MAG: thioester reductase-like protein [Bradymonadia bacterium]|jgi:thioester reductase-like protein